ncbi:MAG: hypothetical protein CXR31_04505 [Geobacter sp.]|nr:MAG: hypothetical protein CXR31_04505 [Geobacter sp.]
MSEERKTAFDVIVLGNRDEQLEAEALVAGADNYAHRSSPQQQKVTQTAPTRVENNIDEALVAGAESWKKCND